MLISKHNWKGCPYWTILRLNRQSPLSLLRCLQQVSRPRQPILLPPWHGRMWNPQRQQEQAPEILLPYDRKLKQDNKKGQGKSDDKGRLSPRAMVQPGATSSTSFLNVPPPLSPRRGGEAPRPRPAVGVAGGHMKLEPLAKFTGKGFPTVRDWLEETANWLELLPCTPNQWINIVGTRLEKGANSWFRAKKANIHAGERAPWVDWQEFA